LLCMSVSSVVMDHRMVARGERACQGVKTWQDPAYY
jgi:hypothetical protein